MARNLWSHWLALAHKIGQFQSRVILTLFYFVVVTPFGLAVRAFGDPLQIKRRAISDASSAWSARHTRDVDLAAGQRQS